LYREKALHESCQVLVEHAHGVAKIRFWNPGRIGFHFKDSAKMTCKQSARNVFVWDAREKVESFSSFPWFPFTSIKTGIRRVQVKNEKDLELENFRSKYNRNNPTGSNQNIVIMIKLSSIYKHDSISFLVLFTLFRVCAFRTITMNQQRIYHLEIFTRDLQEVEKRKTTHQETTECVSSITIPKIFSLRFDKHS